MASKFVYIIVHKPVGVISSTVDTHPCAEIGPRKTVYDIAFDAGFQEVRGPGMRLVGRLDGETSGAILLTTDANLDYHLRQPDPDANATRRSNPFKEKVYRAVFWQRNLGTAFGKVCERTDDELITSLQRPMSFTYKKTHCQTSPAGVKLLRCRFRDMARVPHDPRNEDEAKVRFPELGWCVEVEISLAEGKHHQIRRIAQRDGFLCVSLHRECIAGFLTTGLGGGIETPGQTRYLSSEEVEKLYKGLHIYDRIEEKRVFLETQAREILLNAPTRTRSPVINTKHSRSDASGFSGSLVTVTNEMQSTLLE
eukprot:m.47282 g.47282  ORF g.47282 m.47282 type:complete len:310 (+) comp20456_c0_seq1:269-1198(+)